MQLSHAVKGLVWRGVSVIRNGGGGVSEWEKAKKYKSEVGSWENFSWDEPTEENGGLRTSTNIVYYYVT